MFRVPYSDCHRGGYGLIQWTTENRYLGLGLFCDKYDCDPSSLEGQTRYMINEIHFQKVLPEFEGSGKTVQQYMVPAYYWLGWGIKGNREIYSYNYSKKLLTECGLFSHEYQINQRFKSSQEKQRVLISWHSIKLDSIEKDIECAIDEPTPVECDDGLSTICWCSCSNS